MFSVDIEVRSYDTGYSHRKEIHWKSITSAAAGKYVCRANVVKDDSVDEKTWQVEIVEPKRPEVIDSNIENGKTMKNSLGEPLQMRCKFSGIPRPEIKWYKDGNEITEDSLAESNDSRIALRESDTVLDIHFIRAEDEGRYKCLAANRIGTISREAVLKITSKINLTDLSKTLRNLW